jgi:hypothetical protein
VNTLPNPDWVSEKEGAFYEIRVNGVLDQKWASYFLPFRIAQGEGETVLTGTARDQAELFGILLKLRDMGIPLLSIRPIG